MCWGFPDPGGTAGAGTPSPLQMNPWRRWRLCPWACLSHSTQEIWAIPQPPLHASTLWPLSPALVTQGQEQTIRGSPVPRAQGHYPDWLVLSLLTHSFQGSHSTNYCPRFPWFHLLPAQLWCFLRRPCQVWHVPPLENGVNQTLLASLCLNNNDAHV